MLRKKDDECMRNKKRKTTSGIESGFDRAQRHVWPGATRREALKAYWIRTPIGYSREWRLSLYCLHDYISLYIYIYIYAIKVFTSIKISKRRYLIQLLSIILILYQDSTLCYCCVLYDDYLLNYNRIVRY